MAKQQRSGCLSVLGVFGLIGLALFGVVSLIIGISQQHKYDQTYVVQSDYPDRGCQPGGVTFSVTDGTVLKCTIKGVVPMGQVVAEFPGFATAQDEAITAFARQLGADRLHDDELAQVQDRINQIADGLPPSARPTYHDGLRIGPLWAKSLAWAGGALTAAVALIAFFIRLYQVRIRTP